MTNFPADIYQAEPTANEGKILIITANNTEDLEFFYPYYRLTEEGYHVDVATPNGGEFKGKHQLGLKQTKKIADVRETDYELLYIPGGKAPAELKENAEVLHITREFKESGKPIAAICHGPQVLAAAGVIDGCNISAYPEVQEEIEEAGATYVNQAALTDGQFITGRWPADLPQFTAEVLNALGSKGSSSKQTNARNLETAL